ncbi:hypothetical protein CALVIDRAFT_243953 [Calocera viscosa TUFC12733]|uniref:Uncharacterized protein n=1 Tax=Calocera viscosa (strain TUFC12733) TaxID=1330018 RepID=A0A167JQZ4_CALVF|nr:hypothetical protein CALVIDRAFT_243953 [Calocera viscosa TUFC12733]
MFRRRYSQSELCEHEVTAPPWARVLCGTPIFCSLRARNARVVIPPPPSPPPSPSHMPTHRKFWSSTRPRFQLLPLATHGYITPARPAFFPFTGLSPPTTYQDLGGVRSSASCGDLHRGSPCACCSLLSTHAALPRPPRPGIMRLSRQRSASSPGADLSPSGYSRTYRSLLERVLPSLVSPLRHLALLWPCPLGHNGLPDTCFSATRSPYASSMVWHAFMVGDLRLFVRRLCCPCFPSPLLGPCLFPLLALAVDVLSRPACRYVGAHGLNRRHRAGTSVQSYTCFTHEVICSSRGF